MRGTVPATYVTSILLSGLAGLAALAALGACGDDGAANPDAPTTPGSDADVPGDGTVPDAGHAYEPQPVTYPPSVVPYVEPRVGDGTDEQGGIPPAFAYELGEIASNFDVSEWKRNVGPSQPPNGEDKFRTHCNWSHVAAVDPIVHPGSAGGSHLHMFFGNTGTDENSTYASLRTTGGSTCGGGPLNRSAYWFPAVMKPNALGDGATMVLKPDYAVVYYNVDDREHTRVTRIPRGFSYVFGFNAADPTETGVQGELDAAPGNYVRSSNGFTGWKCENSNGSNANSPVPGSPSQPYLRNADGTATLTCPTGDRIGAGLSGPTCWDGVNLTSPNGRGHVRHRVREINTGQGVCPTGWYHLPSFELVVWFSHQGEADYKEWFVSSDRTGDMSTWFKNGQTFHTDWFGAWDYTVMQEWMTHCNGIKIGSTPGDPHSCIDTAFGQGVGGIVSEAAPDGSRNPQVNLSQRYADQGVNRFEPVPP